MFPRSSLACICSAEKLPYSPLPLHLNLSWVYKDCQLIAWRNDDGGDHFEGLWKNWFAKSCEQEDIRWSTALWTKGLCVHHSRGVHRQTGNSSLLQRKPPGLHHQVLNSLPHTCAVSLCPSPLSAPFNGPLFVGASPADQQKAPSKCSVLKRVQKVWGKEQDWSLSSSMLSRKQTTA